MRPRHMKRSSPPKERFPINSDVLEHSGPWQTYAGGSPAQWPISALVIGNAATTEFAGVLARLSARLDLQVAATIEAALAEIGAEPDLVVLLATRPGEFAGSDIDLLRRAAPLARIVAVLGSWHEGETRTGRPWPAVERVNWAASPAWCERELAALEQGVAGTLSLAATATDEERLLHLVGMESHEESAGIVEIVAANSGMRAFLADACRVAGYQPFVIDIGLPSNAVAPVAGLFDVAGSVADSFAEIEAIVQRGPRMPWIVLASYPRATDRELILRAGAAELVAKPVMVSDLMATIERLRAETH